jgi:predicted ATPase/signal transduction histidine kinase
VGYKLEQISSQIKLKSKNTRKTAAAEVNLKELITNGGIDLSLFFIISMGLCDILTDYHLKKKLNLRINPKNIFINLKNKNVFVNNKAFESLDEFYDSGGLESIGRDVIPYISPELSGMMNRAIDYKSDFYSLGAVLYETLTYKQPFDVKNLSEILYSHTAKLALPPYKINKAVPKQISRIVMKLLSKNPEERYITPWGIKSDLEKCLEQWTNYGKIEWFELAVKDISSTLEIPIKDYGRKVEVSSILGAYNRVANGTSEILTVSGENGMGKTWLVERAKQSIISMGGYFVSGKSNQININIPYEPIIQALKELVQKVISESSSEIELIRNELLQSIGSNIQLMLEFIPELKYIVGSKWNKLELSQRESEYRFYTLFQKFIKIFSRAEHPLVIFLDDIQWSHPASLRLITNLMKYCDNKYLLIILGYRGILDYRTTPKNEVDFLIRTIKNKNTEVTRIALKPLNFNEVCSLLTDTLHCEYCEAEKLSKIILDKTYGNPLFIDQLLKRLYEKKIILFDYSEKMWKWDIEKIMKEDIPDNVVDMVTQKISKLPQSTKRILRYAACLRNKFDIQTLAIISESSLTDILSYLNPALTAGLIEVIGVMPNSLMNITLEQVMNNVEFKFLHDCIQKSAYSMIWQDDEMDVHLKIGKLILENSTVESFRSKIFDIVNHLNLAIPIITVSHEKLKLAGLNLIAGIKAKNTTDYETALNYFNTGLELLSVDRWEEKYRLAFLLSVECIECEYYLGNESNAENLIKEVLEKTKGITDKLQIYILQVKLYSAYGRQTQAVDSAIKGLASIDVNIPTEIDWSMLEKETDRIYELFSDNFEEQILSLPKLKLTKISNVISLLAALSEAAAISNRKLWAYCMLKIVDLSLQYGNSASSNIGYCGFGSIIGKRGLFQEGYRFGYLALNLSNTYRDLYVKMITSYIFGNYICHWKENSDYGIIYLEKALEYSVNIGNLYFTGLTAASVLLVKLETGKNPNKIKSEAAKYLNISNKLKEPILCCYFKLISIILKINEAKESEDLDNILFCLNSLEEKIQNIHNSTIKVLYFTAKARVLTAKGSIDEAAHIIINNKYLYYTMFNDRSYFSYIFYSSLILSHYFEESKACFSSIHMNILKHNLEVIRNVSCLNPRNFSGKYLLLRAEFYKIQGELWEAQLFYEKALDESSKMGLIIDSAVVCEYAAKFYRNQGLETSASAYMEKAWALHEKSNTNLLLYYKENSFNKIIERINVESQSSDFMYEAKEEYLSNIDVDTAIKVSRAISEEIFMDKLLIKLMKIAIESAGAQKGYLILNQEDKLLVEVEGQASENKVSKVKHVLLDEFTNIARSVVYYTYRTSESVILDNAINDNVFSSDNYIIKMRPKSIMCIPITHNETMLGVVYLENNMATNVFKSSKIEVLKLICSQAAIAMENALMFKKINELNDSLEKKVEERTRDIEEFLKKLEYDKLKTEFFANISHELRTPLNVIITANQMVGVTSNEMEEGYAKSYIKKYYQLIQQNCFRLIRLTNNLIDITKIDAGYISTELRNCDIIKIVEDITLSVVEYAGKKEIEIIFDTDIEEKYMACDPDKIERIILNLLSNAIKFTEYQGTIEVLVYDRDKEVEIHVKDTGVGIPEDKKNTIFDRFTQVDKSLSRRCEGSGIGLSLVKSLVEMHEGSIEVFSEYGRGSEFIIKLPVSLVEDEVCVDLEVSSQESKVERAHIEFSDIYF